MFGTRDRLNALRPAGNRGAHAQSGPLAGLVTGGQGIFDVAGCQRLWLLAAARVRLDK